ncbi:ParA family protein, partial [Escherichia coli]|nr:ParA family protein [Escherichia coli]
TMFLDHTHSIGTVLETAAQAMLNNLDAETLREAVIRPTMIPGVDVIPASIDDGFVASQWESLVAEHLPGFKPSEVLRKTIIDRIAD